MTVTRATPRWLRPAFYASVALNLALAGLILGSALGERHRAPPPDAGFGPYGAALTRDERHELRAAFRERAGELRGLPRRMRGEFDRLLGLLRAEPYDAEAAGALILAQQEQVGEAFRLGHRLLVERLAQMSPTERHAFADRLEKVLSGPPDRGERKDGPPEPDDG
ncbi:periplasmic heavy metal sensor [Frigidibacter sp. MR17.24]|uniref:periplasmic heavy metal sensor n=1 Tax=Frigidibacter sp. MR17.24 TaxID=3127345 RepID=UPI003012ECBB